ncbi:YggT family protein [Maricaulaceae bacterium MS644]
MSFGQAIIVYFIVPVLDLLVILLVVNIILSWLIAFNVVNARNQFVAMVWRFSSALLDPFLNPLRRVIPNLGGLDLSPIVFFLVVQFVRNWLLMQQIYPMLG